MKVPQCVPCHKELPLLILGVAVTRCTNLIHSSDRLLQDELLAEYSLRVSNETDAAARGTSVSRKFTSFCFGEGTYSLLQISDEETVYLASQ